MISNKQVKDLVLSKFNNFRYFDYLLVSSLIENNDLELINELKKFQNEDKGFGNSLEADIRMPNSNVAATNIAIGILEDIRDEKIKEDMVKDIVEYLESVYNPKLEAWEIVPKEVDEYPHAVWWNYDSIDKFTYGNPNPEIIGFLYQYRHLLKRIKINHHITKICDYILNVKTEQVSMHSLLSILRFYKRADSDVQNLIKDRIQIFVNKETSFDPSEWNSYVLEPYKIAVIDKSFLNSKQDILQFYRDLD